jgi:hypothetical protein
MNNTDGEPILKKTLQTVAVMVGAWVAFVGTVSLVAVLVTSHAVGGSSAASDGTDANAKTNAPSPASLVGESRRAKAGASRGAPQDPAATPHGHDTI